MVFFPSGQDEEVVEAYKKNILKSYGIKKKKK